MLMSRPSEVTMPRSITASSGQPGPMLLQGESSGIRPAGPAVSEEVEGHGPPRGQPRQEFAVDLVIVGKAVHQDERWVLTCYLPHEDAALGYRPTARLPAQPHRSHRNSASLNLLRSRAVGRGRSVPARDVLLRSWVLPRAGRSAAVR